MSAIDKKKVRNSLSGTNSFLVFFLVYSLQKQTSPKYFDHPQLGVEMSFCINFSAQINLQAIL